MSKLTLAAATLCLSSLVACFPVVVPPPRSQPAPSAPYDPLTYDVAPTDEVRHEAPATPAVSTYPTATRTANPSQVLSPYEPFNVIDVDGFKSGQLARDPSNQKIFRVP
jgi:hypothetical protein